MTKNIKTVGAFLLGFSIASSVTYAQLGARGRNMATVDGTTISPTSVRASGTGDQFMCTSTTAVCEVESSIDATTMTATVPAFDIGPTATPGANDRLACFSYGPSGSKTRTTCFDVEGDVTSIGSFNSSIASGNQAYTCTNTGCRLSLGNTARYLLDDGTNLEFVAPVQGTSFEALATSGNSFVGGNSSTIMLIGSNATDAQTTGSIPAIRLRALQDINDADAIFTVEDFAGNARITIAETGRVTVGGQLTVNGQLQSTSGFSLENYYLTSQRDITIADSGGAGAASYTLANSTGASEVLLTCNDADGCDVALSESGAALRNVKIYNVGTNTVNINDTAGVTEMAGNFAMGQYDSIMFHYLTDRWVENARSNN